MGWSMAQVVECLPDLQEALGSILSTMKEGRGGRGDDGEREEGEERRGRRRRRRSVVFFVLLLVLSSSLRDSES
jgi:hypothetical protein